MNVWNITDIQTRKMENKRVKLESTTYAFQFSDVV